MTDPSSSPSPTAESDSGEQRGQFNSQKMFILAAVGSAVGLGNIWRFPYVAYENGGGSYLIPYLVALFTAGVPFLFFEYAIGHKFRASAPLAFRRLAKSTEWLGWWNVLTCLVIGSYYAAILAWAGQYAYFSLTKAWGADPNAFFFGEVLKVAESPEFSFVPVLEDMWPMIIVWLVTIIIMVAGVSNGIGRLSVVLMPLLVVIFVALVIQSLLLPGASQGLNALFTPNWAALFNPEVWVAAYGQVFFSLSVGFGIMITYASYVGDREDMTGPAAIAAFANSGFELLAGIGVFAALGFMASAQGVDVGDVVSGGIGLAFIAFPAIINQAPAGELLGGLFFFSLVFAGLTSMVSILEVPIAALIDKTGWSRRPAVLVVMIPSAIVSIMVFGSTSGLYALDTVDAFINAFAILAAGLTTTLIVTWGVRKLSVLREHLNEDGTYHVGYWWHVCMGAITPALLGVSLVLEFINKASAPYEGYPNWYVAVFGWGVVVVLLIASAILSFVPWDPAIDTKDLNAVRDAKLKAESTGGHASISATTNDSNA
ncbi:sodium-dependent transporter [Stomatohabitans albus]|uniref:sodium-dependent transporter n=1 Tax=Stomatohabitans albus TaxID=3110766 RepID=UPI00300CA74F